MKLAIAWDGNRMRSSRRDEVEINEESSRVEGGMQKGARKYIQKKKRKECGC